MKHIESIVRSLQQPWEDADFSAQEHAAPEDRANTVKVRFWRLEKGGVYAEWSEASYAVDVGRAVERVEVASNNGDCVHGMRRRLLVCLLCN